MFQSWKVFIFCIMTTLILAPKMAASDFAIIEMSLAVLPSRQSEELSMSILLDGQIITSDPMRQEKDELVIPEEFITLLKDVGPVCQSGEISIY